jgi:hypothetical protein
MVIIAQSISSQVQNESYFSLIKCLINLVFLLLFRILLSFLTSCIFRPLSVPPMMLEFNASVALLVI